MSDEPLVRSWGDLVFHVLAHVGSTAALASSVFDPDYMAFVRRHLGPTRSRSLGQDVRHLARAAGEHAALARVQRLAWLFHDVRRADACAERTLAELRPGEVDRPDLLPTLRSIITSSSSWKTAWKLPTPFLRPP